MHVLIALILQKRMYNTTKMNKLTGSIGHDRVNAIHCASQGFKSLQNSDNG